MSDASVPDVLYYIVDGPDRSWHVTVSKYVADEGTKGKPGMRVVEYVPRAEPADVAALRAELARVAAERDVLIQGWPWFDLNERTRPAESARSVFREGVRWRIYHPSGGIGSYENRIDAVRAAAGLPPESPR